MTEKQQFAYEPLGLELVTDRIDQLQVRGGEVRVPSHPYTHPSASFSQMARISLSLRATVRVEVPRSALISSTVCPFSLRRAMVFKVGSCSFLIRQSNASASKRASS